MRQRRSLSMPKTPGKLYRDGDTEMATALVEALTAAQTDDETAATFTHPFHSYPARMHPATARVLVDVVGDGASRTAPLVDPFCGSGTVLVEARANGLATIGSDLNPLAVLVARAKTWTAPPRRRSQLRETGHAIAGATLEAGKAARRSGAEAAPLRKPRGFDPNARDRRLASWFAPHVRRELELTSRRMHRRSCASDDAELADILTRVPLGDPLQGVVADLGHRSARWVGSQHRAAALAARNCSPSAASGLVGRPR